MPITFTTDQCQILSFKADCGCLILRGSWYRTFSTGNVMCELHGSDSVLYSRPGLTPAQACPELTK